MALPWDEVIKKPEFQALSSGEQEDTRNQYFDSVVAPHIPQDELKSVRQQFDSDTTGTATASDIGKAVMGGFANIVEATGKGVAMLPGETATSIGKSIQNTGHEATDFWIKSMTPAGQKALSNNIVNDDFTLGETPVQSTFLQMFNSAPSTAAMVGPGGLLAKGISKVGGVALEALAKHPGVIGFIARHLPTAVGFGAAEGGTAALQNASQTEYQVRGMSPEEKANSPTYQKFLSQADPSLSLTERDVQATDATAKAAADYVALRTLFSTGGIGIVTGGGAFGMLSRVLGKEAAGEAAKKGFLKLVGTGMGEEWLQETLQSGAEQWIQNKAIQEHVNPTIDPMTGVVSQAAGGGIVGGVMGGFGGGAGYFMQHPKPPEQAIPEAVINAPGPGIDPAIAAATEAASTTTPIPAVTVPPQAAQVAPLAPAGLIRGATLPAPVEPVIAQPQATAAVPEPIAAQTPIPPVPSQIAPIQPVVPVEPVRATPVAPEPISGKPGKRVPTLMDAVAKLGGINLSEKMDVTGDTKGNKKIPYVGNVFTENGVSVDGMAEKLTGAHWFTEAQRNSGDATRKLSAMLLDELSGVRFHYAPGDANAAFENMYQAQAPTPEEERAAGITTVPVSLRDMPNLVLRGRAAMGMDAFENFHESFAEKNADLSDADFERKLTQAIEEAIHATNQAKAAQATENGNRVQGSEQAPATHPAAAEKPAEAITESLAASATGSLPVTETPSQDGVSVFTPTYGQKNKVFTEDAATKARERLKKKLNRLNTGLDPEMMHDAITLAGYHIEGGARKFADFTKAMVNDLGEAIRPYLKSLYLSVRNWPGFDNKGMQTEAEVEAAAKQEAPAISLTPATPEELQAQAEAIKAAEETKAKEEAAVVQAEKKARDKKEREEREARVVKERADEAAATFNLGQAEPSKQVSHDEAAGQKDIFGAAKPATNELSKTTELVIGEPWWNGLTEQQRIDAAVKAGWYTARGTPNFVAKRFAKQSWSEISEGSRATLLRKNNIETKPEDTAYHYTYGEMGMKSNGAFTRDKKDWMTFSPEEAKRMMAGNIKPHGATQRALFVGVESGERLKPPAKPVTPQVTSEPKSEQRAAAPVAESQQAPAPKAGDGEAATTQAGGTPSSTEDVGAELTYNKRNRIKTGIKWSDISDKDAALRVRETTKTNVYPKPDYQALIDGGMQPEHAHIVKQVYDGIAAKPVAKAPTDEQLQTYIEGVNRVMDAAVKWAKSTEGAGTWNGMKGTGKVLLDMAYPDGWRQHEAEVRLLGGNKILGALQPGYDEGQRALTAVKEGWPTPQEAWQKQGFTIVSADNVEASFYAGEHTDGSKYVSISYRMGRNRIENTTIHGATSENDLTVRQVAKARVDELNGKYLLLNKRGSLVSAHATEEAATEAARNAVKRGTESGISDKGISVEAAERIGEARRLEGEDISSEKLIETFGFKGINTGNWLKGKANEAERQLHINHLYDAFLDLAEILDVPPKAMSLNGMLGIAIGAQGSGKAAAHFVPGVNEINLTRTSGAGSLAHEWAHGVDHYFARLAGLERQSEPFLTEHTRTVDADGYTKRAGQKVKAFSDDLRPEVFARFKEIVQAMDKKPMSKGFQDMQRSAAIVHANKNVNGWLASIRRDFEGSAFVPGTRADARQLLLKEFDILAERVRNLDLGDGKISVSSTKAVSPVVAEMRDIYKKASGRNAYSLDQVMGLQANIDHLKYLSEAKDEATDHVPQMQGTDYAREAAKLDAGKSKPYWSTPWEKFARAFDAYISDKLEAKAAKNTYLSHAGRVGETVPKGEERKAINAAFDNLIDTLETKETDQGTAMFSLADDDDARQKLADRIDTILSGESSRVPLYLGETPAILKRLGMPALPVGMDEETADKAMYEHGATTDELKAISDAIADPVAVVDSESKTAPPGSLVVITDLVRSDGRPVIVAIHPDGKLARVSANVVASVYPKDNAKVTVGRWLRDRLRYVNNEKRPDWQRLSGVQFPGKMPMRSVTGKTLLTERDIVKQDRIAVWKQDPFQGQPLFQMQPRLAKPTENVRYDTEETEAAKALRLAVNKAIGDALPKGAFTQRSVPEPLRGITEVINKVFGKKVVYFRNNVPHLIAINGMVPRGQEETMYLNVDANRPLVYVTGHELLHLLRREHPAIYNTLYRMALDEFKPEQVAAFTKKLKSSYERQGINTAVSQDLVHEEMLANFIGDNFARPEFWNALYKQSPSLMQKLAMLVRNFVTSILKAAKLKGFGSEHYFKDLERMRTAAVNALSEYSKTAKGGVIEESGSAKGFDLIGELASKDEELDPSSEEARNVQSGLEGKSPQDAARFLIKNSSKQNAIIAERILFQLNRLERAGVKLEMKIAHVGDNVPTALLVSRGLTKYRFEKNNNRITAWLNGSDVTGKIGVSYETSLHELIHMATIGIVHLGRLKVNVGTKTGIDIAALDAVTNHIIRYFNKRVADSKSGKIELTAFENRMYQGANNAFRDPDEVLAWGLSNADAQTYLESIPYPNHKSAWSAFVTSIRKLLGIPEMAETALSEVLRISENLMGNNVNDLLGLETVEGEAKAIQSESGSGIVEKLASGEFSLADRVPESVRGNATLSRALDMVDNFTGSAKTFGFFKNVNTQLHKARLDPEHFGKVFNLAMNFRTDLSRSAYRAWEHAKDILPAYDDMASATRTLLHGKTASKELSRVSSWIFEGTTKGGASPLDGVRWTDEQLRSKFNATDKEVEIYGQARDAIDSSLTEVANSIAWKLAKPHIGRAIKDNVINNQEEAQDTLLGALNLVRQTANEEDVASVEAAIESVKSVYSQSEKLKQAGYAPLSRFGRYTVDVFRVDDKGKILQGEGGRLEFQKFDFESEAKAEEKRLRKEYAGRHGVVIKRGVQADTRLFSGVDPDTVALFVEQVGEIPGLDIKREVLDEWRREAISQRSAIMHNIKRKGIEGYSQDLPRVLATFLTSNARYASSNFHLSDMLEAINDIPDTMGDVKIDATKLYEYINSSNEPGAWMRGLMFAWYLGGSPAAALVNITQPVLMSFPYLSQYGSAGKHLMSSLRQAIRPALIPMGLRSVMSRAQEEGIVEANEVHHLYDEGMRPIIARLPGGEDLRARAQGAATLWGAFFGMAENFNRRITFLAAYKMAQEMGDSTLKAKGFDNAYDFAKIAVEETQGVYVKENRPNWARGTGTFGAVGPAMFTFKQFSIQYVELLSRMYKSGPEGKAAAGLMLGLLILASGIQGAPGADDLDDLIDTILQSLGYRGNVKKAKRDALKKLAGERMADIVMYGLSAETPIDVQSRLGLGNLFPATGVFKPSEQNKASQLAEILGPPGGLAKTVGDFIDASQSGQRGSAFGAFSPVFIRNIAKAVQMAESGQYKDSRGRKVENVDITDAIIKGIGFQPQNVANQSRLSQLVRQDIAQVKDVESDIASIWAQGINEKDRSEIARAREMLNAWNKKNPETPIRINYQQITRRVKEMRKERSERLAKTAPKEMRRYVNDSLR